MAPQKSAKTPGARRKIPTEDRDANPTSKSTASLSKKRKATTNKVGKVSKVNELRKDDNNDSQRKRVDPEAKDTIQEAELGQPAKKARTSPVPAATLCDSEKKVVSSKANAPKLAKAVNEAPTAPLDIFVFGDGSCAQLGLGSKTVGNISVTEALVPRLNTLLSSEKIGVVQLACGGMHTVALTRDNTILTWGVNDLGALGRDTAVEEDEDDELNPSESVPGLVDTAHLGSGITWSQVVASDNASFALTDNGRVYGWGTFRVCIHVMPCYKKRHLLTMLLVKRRHYGV